MGVFVPLFGRYDPGSEATNLGVFDLCHFDLLKRGCANSVVGLELADRADKIRGFEKGWREGVGDKQTPKKSPKSSPEMCPPSPKGHREKGTEKRPESLTNEGFPHANPLCPPTPFRNF